MIDFIVLSLLTVFIGVLLGVAGIAIYFALDSIKEAAKSEVRDLKAKSLHPVMRERAALFDKRLDALLEFFRLEEKLRKMDYEIDAKDDEIYAIKRHYGNVS